MRGRRRRKKEMAARRTRRLISAIKFVCRWTIVKPLTFLWRGTRDYVLVSIIGFARGLAGREPENMSQSEYVEKRQQQREATANETKGGAEESPDSGTDEDVWSTDGGK